MSDIYITWYGNVTKQKLKSKFVVKDFVTSEESWLTNQVIHKRGLILDDSTRSSNDGLASLTFINSSPYITGVYVL